MPYVSTEKREHFDSLILSLSVVLQQEGHDNGDLNYCISKLVHEWLLLHPDGLRYNAASDAHKAMVCAALEFYRVVVAPYEDLKSKENGPVSILDDPAIALSQKTPR